LREVSNKAKQLAKLSANTCSFNQTSGQKKQLREIGFIWFLKKVEIIFFNIAGLSVNVMILRKIIKSLIKFSAQLEIC